MLALEIISVTSNAILVLLLIFTLIYCLKLNRMIKFLQDTRSEFVDSINQFQDTVKQAEDTIPKLKESSRKICDDIQVRIDRGKYLVDDLSFMIEKTDKIADKMEHDINEARNPASKETSSATQNRTRNISKADRKQEGNLNSYRTREPQDDEVMEPEQNTKRNRKTPAANRSTTARKANVALSTNRSSRSRAEEELMQALRGAR